MTPNTGGYRYNLIYSNPGSGVNIQQYYNHNIRPAQNARVPVHAMKNHNSYKAVIYLPKTSPWQRKIESDLRRLNNNQGYDGWTNRNKNNARKPTYRQVPKNINYSTDYAQTYTFQPDYKSIILELTNEKRKNFCRNPVRLDKYLNDAAKLQADYNNRIGKMTHDYYGKGNFGNFENVPKQNWYKYGENVAVGQPTAEIVFNDWYSSLVHRNNILDCTFNKMGIAKIGPHWAQTFSS
ncbi:hypothetical protein BB560_002025 [Smittium megazygosporum]|uniref:SCP domain-containing protein n=1 Tax=Smittium megazygosporum TaxID=133381 RepID=A0A2T9ZFW2_9FUNG|nr:hypothetical protein BB560_002025 [Smittium megazygosporum]